MILMLGFKVCKQEGLEASLVAIMKGFGVSLRSRFSRL